MKITLLMTLLFGLIFLTTVGAAEKTLTPQQQRMTTCNQQATAQTLKGDARKIYMSDCLKNSKSAPEEKICLALPGEQVKSLTRNIILPPPDPFL